MIEVLVLLILPTLISTESSRQPGCIYQGQKYTEGETFLDKDECNDCTCLKNGAVVCTRKFCMESNSEPSIAGCEYDGKIYSYSESFRSADRCSQCTCLLSGDVACTEPDCQLGCEYGGKMYLPEESFLDADKCNQCTCMSDGKVACTRRLCISCHYNNIRYNPGDIFVSADECNSCACMDDGKVFCGEDPCPDPEPVMCEMAGVFYSVGELVPDIRDLCNECVCQEDGQLLCTTFDCQDITDVYCYWQMGQFLPDVTREAGCETCTCLSTGMWSCVGEPCCLYLETARDGETTRAKRAYNNEMYSDGCNQCECVVEEDVAAPMCTERGCVGMCPYMDWDMVPGYAQIGQRGVRTWDNEEGCMKFCSCEEGKGNEPARIVCEPFCIQF